MAYWGARYWSSSSVAGGGGAAPTAAAIAAAVWDESRASHSTPGTFGVLDNPSGIKKNTALPNFDFVMKNLAGVEAVGLTVTAMRRLDAGAFAACAASPTEVADGVYTINLAATDLNAEKVTLKFTASGAKPTLLTIFTEP